MEYYFIPTRLAKIVEPESTQEWQWYRETGAIRHYWRKDKLTSVIILEQGFAECSEITYVCVWWPTSLSPRNTLLWGLVHMFKREHVWKCSSCWCLRQLWAGVGVSITREMEGLNKVSLWLEHCTAIKSREPDMFFKGLVMYWKACV